MSAISLKSITGITSITTPTGVDDQLTLHTNDTTQRVKVTQSGIEAVGVATFQDIDVDGHTNLDNVSIAGVTTVTGTGSNGLLKVERASGAGLHIQAQSALGVFGTTSNHNLRIISNGNERMMFSTNGNVGINESTPEAKLELDGRFRILDNSDGTPSTGKGLEISYYTSDDLADILSYDRGAAEYKKLQLRGSSIDLKKNNSILCTVGTGGNGTSVGFSTTVNLVTNAERIAVRGYSSFKSTNPAYAAIYLGSEGNTTDTANQLLMFNAGGANRGGFGYVPNTGELRFNHQYFMTFCTGSSLLNGTERLRITSAGKVGIGSDIPVAHLDVANYQNIEVLRLRDRHFNKYLTIRGGGSPNRMIIDSYEGGGGGAGIDLASNGDTKVRIDSSGRVLIGTFTEGFAEGDDLTINSADHGGITIRTPTNKEGNIAFSDTTSGEGEYSGLIRYRHHANDLGLWTNSLLRLLIDSDGQVSIGGRSSVGTLLHVENSSGDAHIRVRGSANCGVLYTRHSDGALIGYTGSGNAVNLGSSNLGISASLSGGDIVFQTGGTASSDERLRITSDGNMGLGLTPAYSGIFGGAQRTFHIGGTAAPCLRITSNASGQADLVMHAGNSGRRVDIANMTANGYISIWTKPSSGSIQQRIKISPDGYVTKPATPAFFATHTAASSAIIGTLTYNTSGNGYYNNGGHLDVSSGQFHAPVNGIYHFHFHGFFQSNQSNNYFEVVMIRKNSGGSGALSLTRQYGYRDQATNQYGPSISMHCTTYLTAGQTVEVSTAGLSFHGANGWYFGGHLLG